MKLFGWWLSLAAACFYCCFSLVDWREKENLVLLIFCANTQIPQINERTYVPRMHAQEN